jgi:hypothetical protein
LVDVSLITSLYRSDAHIESYAERVRALIDAAAAQGVRVEVLIVANEPTPFERAIITRLSASAAHVRLIEIPRETLYASWNRGVCAAHGVAIGFWNVDDARTVEGITAGYARIQAGCRLVHFAHDVVRIHDGTEQVRRYEPIPFDREAHRRIMKCGPFFLFHRDLYAEVGPFDERFRICGDFDWCARATAVTAFCPVNVLGGTFYLHGGNLSDTGDPRQTAECNVAILKNGVPQYLQPCEPDVMQATWERWGDAHLPLDASLKARLWGDGATERYQQALRAKRRQQQRTRISLALRYLPRQFINRTGLRGPLARLGIVKPE